MIMGALGLQNMIICNIAFDIISKNYLSGTYKYTMDIKSSI